MNMRKFLIVVFVLVLIMGLVLGILFNLYNALPKHKFSDVNDAKPILANYAERIDSVLELYFIQSVEWEEEIYDKELILRKEIALEDGGNLIVVLCSAPPYRPEFHIYLTGEELTDAESCQLIPTSFPWLWEIIDILDGDVLSYEKYYSLFESQQDEVLKLIYDENDFYSTQRDLRMGLVPVGSVKYAVLYEYTDEEVVTGYWYTEASIHMYLY